MMSPVAKNGSGKTDWKFYWNLVLPLAITVLLAGVPALIGVGVMQSRLETPQTKRARISEMITERLTPLKEDISNLRVELKGLHRLIDQHTDIAGHSVMVERVGTLSQAVQEVRREMASLESEITKEFLRKDEHSIHHRNN